MATSKRVKVYIPAGTWLPAELYLRIYNRLEDRALGRRRAYAQD